MHIRGRLVAAGLTACAAGCAGPPKADVPLSFCRNDSNPTPPTYVAPPTGLEQFQIRSPDGSACLASAVPQAGLYSLKFRRPDGAISPDPAIKTVRLPKYGRIGFRTGEPGLLVGFADQDEVALSAGSYAWVLDPRSELHGFKRRWWYVSEAADTVAAGIDTVIIAMMDAVVENALGHPEKPDCVTTP